MSLKSSLFGALPVLDWAINSVFALAAAVLALNFSNGTFGSSLEVWFVFGLLIGLQMGDPTGMLRRRIRPSRFIARFCLGLALAAMGQIVHGWIAAGQTDPRMVLFLLNLLMVPVLLGLPIRRLETA